MSVAKSPFRAGSAAAVAPASGGAAGGKALSSEDLQDLLSASFLGKENWTQLRAFLKATLSADALPAANFRKLVAFAVKHLEQGSLPEDTRVKIVDDEAVLVYFTFALAVLQSALAQHTKEATFQADLTKLQVKPEYVTELVNAYKMRREVMGAAVAAKRVQLPTIVNVRWRVDVTISSTSLSRVFRPCVLLQLTLSDGSVQQCECSVEKFHELRYAVAKSLKQALDLSVHPTITREIE